MQESLQHRWLAVQSASVVQPPGSTVVVVAFTGTSVVVVVVGWGVVVVADSAVVVVVVWQLPLASQVPVQQTPSLGQTRAGNGQQLP
jgi:hypothetical protein